MGDDDDANSGCPAKRAASLGVGRVGGDDDGGDLTTTTRTMLTMHCLYYCCSVLEFDY